MCLWMKLLHLCKRVQPLKCNSPLQVRCTGCWCKLFTANNLAALQSIDPFNVLFTKIVYHKDPSGTLQILLSHCKPNGLTDRLKLTLLQMLMLMQTCTLSIAVFTCANAHVHVTMTGWQKQNAAHHPSM